MMNNKKFFSVNMFWQSYKQLKAIGIVATVLMLVIGIFPIIMQVVDIEMAKKLYVDDLYYAHMIAVSVIDVISAHGYLGVMFIVVTPLFALNAWKFMNKRDTSDFYHSLPYTRICLFLSKTAAVLIWILEILVISYAAVSITYLATSKYFIVDHGVLFRLYITIFLCCLLVFGAVSMACAVTGNMFNNVVVSGLIILLPRVMMLLVSSAVANMTYIVPDNKAISFINDTQNIVVSWMGALVAKRDLVLSAQANVYTLLLAIIYMVLAAILFIKRKSEAAGKAAYGKVTGFSIKFVIAMFISAMGTMSVAVNAYTVVEQSELERASYVYMVISMLITGALVVFVYEFFSSRHNFKLKKCVLPVVAGWGVAGILAFAVNVAADSILSYEPAKEDMEYVIISNADRYDGYSDERVYYDSIMARTKISDDKVLAIVSDALKNNINKVKNDEYDEFYRNIFDGDAKDGKGYVEYQVYIKDGVFGKYRTLYFTAEQETQLVSSMLNIESYKQGYYDLPDYEDVYVKWMSAGEQSDEDRKVLYETFLAELKTVPFKDYYNEVSTLNMAVDGLNLHMQFTKDGYIYVQTLRIGGDVFPKTIAKNYEISNKNARKNEEVLRETKNTLKQYINNDINLEELKRKYVNLVIFKPDKVEDEVVVVGADMVLEHKEIKNVLYPAVLKELESDMKYDYSDKDKLVVRVGYYNNKSDHTVDEEAYYIMIDKDIAMDWHGLMR